MDLITCCNISIILSCAILLFLNAFNYMLLLDVVIRSSDIRKYP